jgi:YD repeat-containing protein
VFRIEIKRIIFVSIIAFGISAACRTSNRQTPIPAPTVKPTLAAPRQDIPHPRWRARHKGGASIATGVYMREDDDLVVDTPLPIVLTRTYQSGDGYSRRFGMNTTHPGEWWLSGNGDPRIPWADLILPKWRLHFVRISPGDRQEGAVLRHDSTPTEFNGALLSWTGSLWEMRLRDGSVASFLDCQKEKEVCSLVERRDPDGHRIAYVRNASGLLLRMESDGQSIAFDYDDRKRIVRAYDTSRREVSYTYDDGGRLVRAAGSDGIVRTYEYDQRDKLTVIREPGRIILNWFDDAGRWVKQVVKRSEDDHDPYIATVRYVIDGGSIVESDFDEGDGLIVTRYNAHGYVTSETMRAETLAPVVFTHDRNPVSNVLIRLTMSCAGPSGSIVRPLPPALANDDAAKTALFLESCRPAGLRQR